MNTWHTLNLGDAMLAGEALEQARTRVLAACLGAACPPDMAVFQRHESEGRLHCELKLYFSPAAQDIARELGASACAAPSPAGLGLLAGSADARSLLFP